MQTLSGLIEQSLNRLKEATIGVLDITDDKLRGPPAPTDQQRIG